MLDESLKWIGDFFPPFSLPTKRVVGVRIELIVVHPSDVLLDLLVHISSMGSSSQADVVPVEMPSIDRDK